MNDQMPVVQIPKSGEIRMTIQGEEASVRLARELARYALINWGYERSLVDDSAVVMSEIVTNAVEAAAGRALRIRIAVHEGAPLLECWTRRRNSPPLRRRPGRPERPRTRDHRRLRQGHRRPPVRHRPGQDRLGPHARHRPRPARSVPASPPGLTATAGIESHPMCIMRR